MEFTKEDVGLNLVDLERAATNLMCESDTSSDDSDIDDKLAKLSLNKKAITRGLPTDLQVAAEAARMSSSSDSELDSDDTSSEESDD